MINLWTYPFLEKATGVLSVTIQRIKQGSSQPGQAFLSSIRAGLSSPTQAPTTLQTHHLPSTSEPLDMESSCLLHLASTSSHLSTVRAQLSPESSPGTLCAERVPLPPRALRLRICFSCRPHQSILLLASSLPWSKRGPGCRFPSHSGNCWAWDTLVFAEWRNNTGFVC